MADELTEKIIGAAIEVHRVLGVGLLEVVYELALCHEFDLRGLSYQRQVAIDVVYKGVTIHGQRLDLLVNGEVIVELKAQMKLADNTYAQLLSYLKVKGLKRGLVINFAESKLVNGIKRISL